MTFEYAVVGAGIVGLATALQIRQKFPQARILILDKEILPALHQSGHNSGVLHSGIYYKPGSLKAQLSRRGLQLMVDFCRDNSVEFEICGKMIVALNENEIPRLKDLADRAEKNQLNQVRWLDAQGVRSYEPSVQCKAGLWVPETGIVDYASVCRKMVQLLENQNVQFQFGCEIFNSNSNEKSDEIILQTGKGEFQAKKVIFCGGLQSDRLARSSFGKQALDLRIIPFRGEYYKIKKDQESIVKNLVYPVPNPELPFLGVHLTRMIQGGLEAGPNAVLSLKRECYGSYGFNWADSLETLTWPGFYKLAWKYLGVGAEEILRTISRHQFAKAVQKMVPDLKEENLEFAFAGVRAQAVSRQGALMDDFVILRKGNRIHVCNAPSPAATASLAIGEHLVKSL